MAMTSIEWTATRNADGTTSPGQTWNPVAGCSIKSAGCSRCYAMRMAARLEAMGQAKYVGTTKKVNGKAVWTGLLMTDDDALAIPLRRAKPTTWFVNSMSDLFWGDDADLAAARKMGTSDPKPVPFDFIDRVFAVMALTPHHTYQILTKRPERMAEYAVSRGQFPGCERLLQALHVQRDGERHGAGMYPTWPLPNVWVGTSTEDQQRADERIPHLLRCPAAVRFLSCEPLLGPLNLDSNKGGTRWIGGQRGCGQTHRGVGTPECPREPHHHHDDRCEPGVDWVIVGGESGPDSRFMHPDWARSIRNQCNAAGVPFFFKQWGEYAYADFALVEDRDHIHTVDRDGQGWALSVRDGKLSWLGPKDSMWTLDQPACPVPGLVEWRRAGKKAAGRLLDGREWNEMPAPRPAAVA
jgi:protein gp37